MRALTLLVAVAALHVPCQPCMGFLQSSSDSPCGCGTGLVRKVHTRDELDGMSQVQLDTLLRDTERELDEAKGNEEYMTKKHETGLKKLNETVTDMQNSLWDKSAETKGSYAETQSKYSQDAETVATIEANIAKMSDELSGAKSSLSMLHKELEYPLMSAAGCQCKAAEDAAAALLSVRSRGHQTKAQLLTVHAKTKGVNLETVFEIERLEAEFVLVLTETGAAQAAYDKNVRDLNALTEKAQINGKMVAGQQERAAEFLNTRVKAQDKALTALRTMESRKHDDVERVKGDLEAAKEKLASLEEELANCGCK